MNTQTKLQFSSISSDIYFEITQFLHLESKLLDDRMFHDWLSLLSEDIDYRVPIRTTKYKKDGNEFSNTSYHFFEDYFSLKKRIERLDTKHAWAEDPPSRVRHFFSNITVKATEKTDEFEVFSNLMVCRNRGDSTNVNVLTGERVDIIRKTDNFYELVKRTIHLDLTTLPTDNLSMIL